MAYVADPSSVSAQKLNDAGDALPKKQRRSSEVTAMVKATELQNKTQTEWAPDFHWEARAQKTTFTGLGATLTSTARKVGANYKNDEAVALAQQLLDMKEALDTKQLLFDKLRLSASECVLQALPEEHVVAIKTFPETLFSTITTVVGHSLIDRVFIESSCVVALGRMVAFTDHDKLAPTHHHFDLGILDTLASTGVDSGKHAGEKVQRQLVHALVDKMWKQSDLPLLLRVLFNYDVPLWN